MGYTNPEYVRRVDADSLAVYDPSNTLAVTIDKAAASTTISGSSTNGHALVLKANTVNTNPKIELSGNSTFYLIAFNQLIMGFGGTVSTLTFTYATPDFIIEPIAEKNIFLKTSGAGLVKFGTYDATPALASSGFIPILDAAGNTRKLMVQA